MRVEGSATLQKMYGDQLEAEQDRLNAAQESFLADQVRTHQAHIRRVHIQQTMPPACRMTYACRLSGPNLLHLLK